MAAEAPRNATNTYRRMTNLWARERLEKQRIHSDVASLSGRMEP